MGTVHAAHLHEARELLEELRSWSEDRIDRLPKLSREKAREYRNQAERGVE